MAVIKSNIAKKYSTIAFFLSFFTKFLIPEPNAAHIDMDIGQIIKAVIEMKKMAVIRFSSLGKKIGVASLRSSRPERNGSLPAPARQSG